MLEIHTRDHHHHHHRHHQQACDSTAENSAMPDLLTGSRLIVTTAGTQLAPQTPPDCACSLSSSTSVTTITESSVTSVTTPVAAHCSPSLTNACPPLYPVYPPYIVMGISVQPITYPPPQTDPALSPGIVAGSRKRLGGKQLAPHAKRRPRKRYQHGDVVSSTTPDSHQLETTSGRHAFPLPSEMTSSAADEAEVTSPLCLSVKREKLVYDSCGALDLTIRK